MKTAGHIGTALRYVAGAGCLVAVLGLCSVAGGIISESPMDAALGWRVLAVGTAVLGSAVIFLLGRRYRHGCS